MTVGNTLKKIRKEKGMTQVEFAKFIGMSRSFIGDIENNRYTPDPKTVEKLSEKLGISTYYLTTGKETYDDIFPFKTKSPKVSGEQIENILTSLKKSELSYAELSFLNNSFNFMMDFNDEDIKIMSSILRVLVYNDSSYKYSTDEEKEAILKDIDENTERFRNLLKRRYGYEGD